MTTWEVQVPCAPVSTTPATQADPDDSPAVAAELGRLSARLDVIVSALERPPAAAATASEEATG